VWKIINEPEMDTKPYKARREPGEKKRGWDVDLAGSD
jgi:hypothetical protein